MRKINSKLRLHARASSHGGTMEYLAVFKGRSGALAAESALKSAGVPVRVVNTPRETGFGCGISLLVAAAYFAAAARILNGRRDSFSGWWSVTPTPRGRLYNRI